MLFVMTIAGCAFWPIGSIRRLRSRWHPIGIAGSTAVLSVPAYTFTTELFPTELRAAMPMPGRTT